MPKPNSQHSGAIVVTGASTGIGKACALFLDQKGYTVFAGVRKQSDADSLKQKASERLIPIILEVTDKGQIADAVETVANAVGEAGLVGLVNNAGIAVAAPLEFVPLDCLRRQLEVNVVGVIAVTQAFLPLLRKAKGRIVNIGSFGGTISGPILSPYSATKFALESLSDALRMELHPWGIEVALIKPGAIQTPIWDKTLDLKTELAKELPPQAFHLYANAIDRIVTYSKRSAKNGASVDVVSKAIFHALTAHKPKTRYILATNRLLFTLLKLMPDRLRDYLILRRLGISK